MSIISLVRRSLENPSTPLSAPDDWLYTALGAYKSSAGVSVNAQTALTYSAFWRAVNLISSDTAKLPLLVYKKKGKARQVAIKHPAYKLLRRKPNSETKAFDFRRTLMGHALSVGNGYAYIVRSGAGDPLELIQLNPLVTYPVRANGRLWYVTEPPNSEMRKLPADDVLHIKGLSFDGMQAYSIVEKARETLGLGMALETYGSIFFQNAARPAVVLEHPGKLTEPAAKNLRESWERMQAGLKNAHRTAVLTEGMTAKPLSISARDAQLIEERQFQIREVANFTGVPSHKLGDTARSGYNSLEQEDQDYLDSTLDQWLVSWEEECWDKLLREREKDNESVIVEFDRRKLIRANLAARGTYYSTGLQNGWLCIDEVRDEEGYNPLPNNLGEKHYKQVNLQEVGAEPPEPEPTADPNNPKPGDDQVDGNKPKDSDKEND
jgi:HK97 family phage portal protein